MYSGQPSANDAAGQAAAFARTRNRLARVSTHRRRQDTAAEQPPAKREPLADQADRHGVTQTLTRVWQIGWAFAGHGAWLLLRRVRLMPRVVSPAERLTQLLQRLGTAFIKLGQHLSLRPDLLPPDYIAALERLQDHVEPFSGAAARREVERALGAPVAHLFERFDELPFAAGSIAQIHSAKLHDGRRVVVKIRRPGIAAQIEQDMRIFRGITRAAQRLLPSLAAYDPLSVVEEIRHNLQLELDFHREARHVRRFAQAFSDSQTVTVPDIVDGMCAATVFVQIYSRGRHIDTVHDPQQGSKLAHALLDAYVLQLFTLGLFHGDPHPGNLFVMADGRLCFHDFGIVGYLSPTLRRALAAFAAGFAAQDSDWVVDAWVEMGVVAQAPQRSALRHVVDELLREYAQRPMSQWSLAEAFMQLIATGRTGAVRMPRDLVVLSRTVLLLESMLRRLAPDFSVFEALSTQAREIMRSAQQLPALSVARLKYELIATAQVLPTLIAQMLQDLRERGAQAPMMSAPREQPPRPATGEPVVALALVALGLYIAASLLVRHSVGPVYVGMPVLSIAGYVVASYYTLRVARAARRAGL